MAIARHVTLTRLRPSARPEAALSIDVFGDVGGRHGKVQKSTASTICERGLLQGRLERHGTYILMLIATLVL